MPRCGIIWQILCKNLLRKSRPKAGCYALPGKTQKVEKLLYLCENQAVAPKITKTRKLHYFRIIVNICAYHGHKNRQKDENSICFSSIYIQDLNLAPIRFVQFVLRFFPRCPLYSFIIPMFLI